MACVGVILGLVGIDQITAAPRLTFDRLELLDGVGLVPVVMGLFGVAEILSNLERSIQREVVSERIGSLWPTLRGLGLTRNGRSCAARSWASSSACLPGGGAVISSFASYAMEKALFEATRNVRQGRHRGRRRAGSGQQRGGRWRLHSAADARHPAERGDGAAARRLHHPRPAARPAADDAEPRTSSGASSPACTSATSCCWCSTCR